MVSIGGVLITDIVANVVGGYITDRIKTSWDVPQQRAGRATSSSECDRDGLEHPASGKPGAGDDGSRCAETSLGSHA